jgi:predicted transposase YdaD
MSFTYDISKDTLYKEGVEKGLEKGIEKGKHEVVLRMLKSGTLSTAQIAEFADVPEKQVLQLQKKLAEKKK